MPKSPEGGHVPSPEEVREDEEKIKFEEQEKEREQAKAMIESALDKLDLKDSKPFPHDEVLKWFEVVATEIEEKFPHIRVFLQTTGWIKDVAGTDRRIAKDEERWGGLSPDGKNAPIYIERLRDLILFMTSYEMDHFWDSDYEDADEEDMRYAARTSESNL